MKTKISLLISLFFIITICTSGRNREPYQLKKEITVRWGWTDYDWDDDFSVFTYDETPLERYNNGKYYYDEKRYTHALSFSYTSEIKRWLALSLVGTYSGTFRNERESGTDKIVDKYKKQVFSVFPMVKFTYLNRPYIRLYSAVGLGVGFKSEKWDNNAQSGFETRFGGQLTFFGVSVGKDLFASWELGTGSMGILTVGAGYRF
jgi:hypothetical protein